MYCVRKIFDASTYFIRSQKSYEFVVHLQVLPFNSGVETPAEARKQSRNFPGNHRPYNILNPSERGIAILAPSNVASRILCSFAWRPAGRVVGCRHCSLDRSIKWMRAQKERAYFQKERDETRIYNSIHLVMVLRSRCKLNAFRR